MPTVFCNGGGQEIGIPAGIRGGEIFDCPNGAGLSLRASEKDGLWAVTEVKKASCAVGEEMIILPDDVKPGDIIECHGARQRVTYEFGAYALERVEGLLRDQHRGAGDGRTGRLVWGVWGERVLHRSAACSPSLLSSSAWGVGHLWPRPCDTGPYSFPSASWGSAWAITSTSRNGGAAARWAAGWRAPGSTWSCWSWHRSWSQPNWHLCCFLRRSGRSRWGSEVDRRAALTALLMLPILFMMLQAACDSRDVASPTASSNAQAERAAGSVAQVTLRIEGMTGFTGALVVKRALEGLDGVEKTEVNFSRGEARVEYEPRKVTVEAMIQAVRDAGFRASRLSPQPGP